MLRHATLLTLTGVLGLGAVTAQASDRRYLAVDQSLHGTLSNAQMVMGQAVEAQEINLIPTGMNYSMGYLGSVIKGHDDVYRMYYEIRTPDGFAGAVAYSNDGFNWTLPANNLAPTLIDHPNSNLLNVASHGAMHDGKWYDNPVVYYDDKAPVSERYKMMWNGERPSGGSGGYIAVSSDGLNFTTIHTPDDPAWKWKADTGHSFFYDDLKNEWVAYGRIRSAPWAHSGGWTSGDIDRRGIVLHSSSTLEGTWDNVGQVVADPQDYHTYTTHPNSISVYPEGSGPDFYTPGVQIYHGQYIGKPGVFFRDPARLVGNRVTGPHYPVLMHSLDGENWDFPDLYHPIIDIEPYERISDNPNSTSYDLEIGQMYSTANFIEVGDELLFYYSVASNNHYEPSSGPNGVFVGTMRQDGFASIRADENETAEWVTSSLVLPYRVDNLIVNADILGSLQVEVLSGGDAISGFSLADSVAFTGNQTNAAMQWNSSTLRSLAGQEVQFSFQFDDGDMYAFWFELGDVMLHQTGFDAGYNTGNLAGQNGWTTNGAAQGSWQVITPGSGQPAAPEGEQYAAITKVAGQGSPRAYHELAPGGEVLSEAFTFEARMAYADIVTNTNDGIFLGAYINNVEGDSSGVIFGFTEIDGEIHLTYRNGNDYISMGLADEDTFYHFLVDVNPNGALTTYDITVLDLLGNEITSATDALSRNGLGDFSVLQLAVGTGNWGGTLYVDGINLIPEPASLALLGIGGMMLMRRRRTA